MQDDFKPTEEDLALTLEALLSTSSQRPVDSLPAALPEVGLRSREALTVLAPIVLGGARDLGEAVAFAHMDPPTPWVTWVAALWNASLNQNLLHPDVAPVARDIERRVIDWIAPAFAMDGGHMTPGSSVSTLTALWAARELRSVRRVVASAGAHLSVAKAAHLLGLEYVQVPAEPTGAIVADGLPRDLADAALVLTAGATSTGAIDPLRLCGRAAWTHVDAAWAGPLRFSPRYSELLAGIEAADSVAVSGHKWMFQPKESALVLFADTASANDAISYGGAYLATPNVGLLGSHGANAVPLLATLMAWGRQGLAMRIEQAMALAQQLHDWLRADGRVVTFGPPQSGVLLWRPASGSAESVRAHLPPSTCSLTQVAGVGWLRHVAANPMANLQAICAAIERALSQHA